MALKQNGGSSPPPPAEVHSCQILSFSTMISFNLHIYFSLIVKQVLTAYLNLSLVRFLEPSSTGVI